MGLDSYYLHWAGVQTPAVVPRAERGRSALGTVLFERGSLPIPLITPIPRTELAGSGAWPVRRGETRP